MLRSVKEIHGYSLDATDDRLGKVQDLLFDDREWEVRYLVADTRRWLPGRTVLISPRSLGRPDWSSHSLPVALTRKQIEESPSLAQQQPVSRQYEDALVKHYGWPAYWGWGPISPSAARAAAQETTPPAWATGALRSAREVTGYDIEARDDDIGHVEDFIVDDDLWLLRYLVVDTRNWLPGGKKVLIAPLWAEDIDWTERRVRLDLTKQQVEDSPEYDPAIPINRELEAQLYDFYGRPVYWSSRSSTS